jgi:DNA-binding cell septation regulator SpoVG
MSASRPRNAVERQAAETVGFGARPLRLLKWQAYRNPAGTMLGFLDVELSSSLVVKNLRLVCGPKGRRFIAMPALKQTDGTWSDILDFRDRGTRDRFASPILELLRRLHPEQFE